MNFVVLLLVCALSCNAFQIQNRTNETPQFRSIFENISSSFSSNWSSLSDKVGDLLVVKKNIIAAYPFQIISTIMDRLCTSTLFMHRVPPKFTPDITQMYFQYITPCRNYSVPLTEAHKLWQHMSFTRHRERKVVILATGWTNTVNDSSTLALLSQAFLCRKDVNFIKHVGHSLGAHIMGTAGRTFYKLTGRKIQRITGLDPAKPCFLKYNKLSSLRRGDAKFVDIIHTNIGILAKETPMGNIDFYPGGANALPPGCLSASCAHSRAVEYFAESAYPGNWENFIGMKCENWRDLKNLNCTSTDTTSMGYVVNRQKRGIYYVPVNRKSPYGKFAKPNSLLWQYVKCNTCFQVKESEFFIT